MLLFTVLQTLILVSCLSYSNMTTWSLLLILNFNFDSFTLETILKKDFTRHVTESADLSWEYIWSNNVKKGLCTVNISSVDFMSSDHLCILLACSNIEEMSVHKRSFDTEIQCKFCLFSLFVVGSQTKYIYIYIVLVVSVNITKVYISDSSCCSGVELSPNTKSKL